MTNAGTGQDASKLPIIDITPYLSDGNAEARSSTSNAIHAACIEYGFFYLDISKYIDLSEPEELTRLAREFFGLPQSEKDKISLKNEDQARGLFVAYYQNEVQWFDRNQY
jgi:isopenicillin N synthase-like dioxygenase